ncbi:hypothetical protein [Lactococcus allomyrinae]|uniref:MucBP domain-containing protein n=1 Tax=Lactococcus allomyrinae TaxID=2419773 RepID=A0A387BI86_9LACT|nr:hypothetical protein [Lactococcus allomyrinae]AYG00590.1 hypothetical protein D7I46_05475 [Lactococcus allomyrinae]
MTHTGKTNQVIPYLSGYIPAAVGVDLIPVNQKDFNQGYLLPDLPKNLSKNIIINYRKNSKAYEVIIKYVDKNGKDLLPSVVQTDKGEADFTLTAPLISNYLLLDIQYTPRAQKEVVKEI